MGWVSALSFSRGELGEGEGGLLQDNTFQPANTARRTKPGCSTTFEAVSWGFLSLGKRGREVTLAIRSLLGLYHHCCGGGGEDDDGRRGAHSELRSGRGYERWEGGKVRRVRDEGGRRKAGTARGSDDMRYIPPSRPHHQASIHHGISIHPNQHHTHSTAPLINIPPNQCTIPSSDPLHWGRSEVELTIDATVV